MYQTEISKYFGDATPKGIEWIVYSKIRPLSELQKNAVMNGGRPEEVDTSVTAKSKKNSGQKESFRLIYSIASTSTSSSLWLGSNVKQT